MISADLRRALSSIGSARLRALLTLLGVVMSTSSFVLLVALIRGGEERLAAMEEQVNDTELVIVRATAPPHGSEQRAGRVLSHSDAQVLQSSRALGGARVAVEQNRGTKTQRGGREQRVNVMSAPPGALELYRLELGRGRYLNEADFKEQRRTCVIGSELWEKLLDSSAELDAELEIDGELWSVVGVLRPKPSMASGDASNSWNRRVLVPETSFDLAYNPQHEAERLFLRPAGKPAPAALLTLEAITQSTLLRLHQGLSNFALAPRQEREQAQLIFRIVQILLVGTALVSLLVGGINVMNVMLVTVTERTREIGIRRAVGASPRAIIRQFLVEAMLLTSLGGFFGVALGCALGWGSALVLRQLVGQWPLHLELWAILLGVGLSMATGLVFGLYPARRAAQLDVIEAL
ncbi:MAG TPA: ABC transporter permease, partial [Polyangiaceae bacterium]|nr:ABC transporter permease [Polyangiaceae bacterium]